MIQNQDSIFQDVDWKNSIGPASAEITIPEQIAPPEYTMTIVGMGIAVMAVVAVVGLLIYKKK